MAKQEALSKETIKINSTTSTIDKKQNEEGRVVGLCREPSCELSRLRRPSREARPGCCKSGWRVPSEERARASIRVIHSVHGSSEVV